MQKMKTMQPEVSVCTGRVPPVPGVARQMAWWLQKQALARLHSHAGGELSLSLSLMPQSHFSLLSSVSTAQVCWTGSLNWVVLLIQVNHLGFDYFSISFAFTSSQLPLFLFAFIM